MISDGHQSMRYILSSFQRKEIPLLTYQIMLTLTAKST